MSEVISTPTPTTQLHLQLGAQPLSSRLARRVAGDLIRELGYTCTVEDVELVVSELVTNAVAHTDTEVEIDLTVSPHGSTHVRVLDHGDGEPSPRDTGTDEIGGRGLQIVAALTTSWGWQPNEHQPGKTVWATVPGPGS